MTQYTEIIFEADVTTQELLLAELEWVHFDSFIQEDHLLTAYCESHHYPGNLKEIEAILARYPARLIRVNEMDDTVNWNKDWESNFKPVALGEMLYIRATFHDPGNHYPFEIVIQPKMSFGTGHHETTQLMMEMMLNIEFKDAVCLDMGCGTGVLGILASMKGASWVVAVDNDPWCYENTLENLELNQVKNCTAIQGDTAKLNTPDFLMAWERIQDKFILSNITKNQNIANLEAYHNISQKGSVILLSGFYEEDVPGLINEAERYGMKFVKSKTKNKWSAVQFIRV